MNLYFRIRLLCIPMLLLLASLAGATATLSSFGAHTLHSAHNGTMLMADHLQYNVNADAQKTAQIFFRTYAEELRLNNPDQELRMHSVERDDRGTSHIRFDQHYAGLPVWENQIVAHVDAHGALVCVNGRYVPTPTGVNIRPAIVASRATHIVQQEMATTVMPLSNALGIYALTGAPTLAYRVEVFKNAMHHWVYFVNAQSGAILFRLNTVAFLTYTPAMENPRFGDERQSTSSHITTPEPLSGSADTGHGYGFEPGLQSFGVYHAGNSYRMVDISKPMFNPPVYGYPDTVIRKGELTTATADNLEPWQLDWEAGTFQSTSSMFTDSAAVAAHVGIARVYDFYWNRYRRNSFNDSGASYFAMVHFGVKYENAYWDGSEMVFGDGDTLFRSLSAGMDVVGHELTHAVTERTSGLMYTTEPGAINEAMSDIMGTAIEDKNWELGEGVTVHAPGYLRHMSNPHRGVPSTPYSGDADSAMIATVAQPESMKEFFYTTNDAGGVHENSGIINRAGYLVALGYDPLADTMGRRKMGDVFYGADIHYLTPLATFGDCRRACIHAAADRGYDTSVIVAAFDTVGINSDFDNIVSVSNAIYPFQQFVPKSKSTYAVQLNFRPGLGFDAAPFAVVHKIAFTANWPNSSSLTNTPLLFSLIPSVNDKPDVNASHAILAVPETLTANESLGDTNNRGYIYYQWRLSTPVFFTNWMFLAMTFNGVGGHDGADICMNTYQDSSWRNSAFGSAQSKWVKTDTSVSMEAIVSFINDTAAYLRELTGVEEKAFQTIVSPESMEVFPNPATHQASAVFTLDHASSIDISVIDISGRQVRQTMHDDLGAGRHAYMFDTQGLAAGVYQVVLTPKTGAPVHASILVTK